MSNCICGTKAEANETPCKGEDYSVCVHCLSYTLKYVQSELLLPLVKTSKFNAEFNFSEYPELKVFIEVVKDAMWDELYPQHSRQKEIDYDVVRQMCEIYYTSQEIEVPSWYEVKMLSEDLKLTHLGNISDLKKVLTLNLRLESFFDFYLWVEKKALLEHFEAEVKTAS